MNTVIRAHACAPLIKRITIRRPMSGVKPVKAGWWNAFRPWTLHGAVVPVLIGGAVAYRDGSFDLLIFILVMIGGCLLQSAANLLNTYGDFSKGTDTVENETRSPELVTGVLKPKHVFLMGAACILVTCLIGLVFIWKTGWGVLVYGILGIIGAGMYTIGLSFKYHGTGQFVVFLMMGLLMPMGTYFVLTGQHSLDVLLLSLPNAFMITAVLCGNEMRDYEEDKKAGVGTLCGHMSYGNGMRLYLAENAVAFPILLVLIIVGVAPVGCALAFITLYDFHKLYVNSRKAPTDPHAGFMLVPLCFKLNWHFGVLLTVGFVIQTIVLPMVI